MKDFFKESAEKFEMCIRGYLQKEETKNNTDERFMELVKSIKFKNNRISPECELFKYMKTYTDKYPIDKISLIWQTNFEDMPTDTFKAVLIELLS